MRISDWSSDVCSSDLEGTPAPFPPGSVMIVEFTLDGRPFMGLNGGPQFPISEAISMTVDCADQAEIDHYWDALLADGGQPGPCGWLKDRFGVSWQVFPRALIQMHKRSEEHTSELQSLMRISDAVFCLKKKKKTNVH